MRIVFMGTPAFAVPSLAGLIAAGHDIAAVYTQPPRPSGRGHKLTPSPVQQLAESHGLEVRHPENFKAAEDREAFAALEPDVAVVVAYGLILPKAILDAPTHGCVNLHGSLLPRWRGAAPVQRAIMAGDKVTGVQVMQMEKGLDTGPILLSETVPILPTDTGGALGERMAQIGAELLPRTLAALDRGGIAPTPQAEEGVTYAHKIDAEQAKVDWQQSADAIDGHIRGLSPIPGAWCVHRRDGEDHRLKLWFSEASDTETSDLPGTVIAADEDGVLVAAGDGRAVRLLRLQRPGKAAQEAGAFLRGWPLTVGDRLS